MSPYPYPMRLIAAALLPPADRRRPNRAEHHHHLRLRANGNRTRITDPLNRVTTNQYDALNRLIRITDREAGKPNSATTPSTNSPKSPTRGISSPPTL